MKFGEKLVKLRKGQGMSQEKLAEKLGVSRQAISRWENEDTWPDVENVLGISELLQVSTDYLLHEAYESDQDIPIVQDTSHTLKRGQQRWIAGSIDRGFLVICSLAMVFGWYSQRDGLWFAGLIGQVACVVGLEGIAAYFSDMADSKPWKNRQYRIAIWMLALFPAYILSKGIFALYPRPFLAIAQDIVAIGLYIIFSGVGWYLLRKKTGE